MRNLLPSASRISVTENGQTSIFMILGFIGRSLHDVALWLGSSAYTPDRFGPTRNQKNKKGTNQQVPFFVAKSQPASQPASQPSGRKEIGSWGGRKMDGEWPGPVRLRSGRLCPLWLCVPPWAPPAGGV